MFSLLLSAAIATAPVHDACSWAHPGANPYHDRPLTAALKDFDLTPEQRSSLSERMNAHKYDDMVTITRDTIEGSLGEYGQFRDMHSGHGITCHGEVDRSEWSDTHKERALVYCAGDECVIVPVVCDNVAMVTRRQYSAGGGGSSEALVAPRTGPVFIPMVEPTPVAAATEVLPSEPTFQSVSSFPVLNTGIPMGSGVGGWSGGGFPHCPPPCIPPISCVPEPSTYLMLGAGLMYLLYRRRA